MAAHGSVERQSRMAVPNGGAALGTDLGGLPAVPGADPGFEADPDGRRLRREVVAAGLAAVRGRRAAVRVPGVEGAGHLGLYPIVTVQYRSTTVYQVSYQIQSLLFESDNRILP